MKKEEEKFPAVKKMQKFSQYKSGTKLFRNQSTHNTTFHVANKEDFSNHFATFNLSFSDKIQFHFISSFNQTTLLNYSSENEKDCRERKKN